MNSNHLIEPGQVTNLLDVIEALQRQEQELGNVQVRVGGPRRDVDVLYEYNDLGARAAAYGLTLSASRTHIIMRDKRHQVIVQKETLAEAREQLQYEIDNCYVEHHFLRREE